MRQTGIVLWVAGSVLAAFAMFVFDTSIGGFDGRRIVNLDLQQRQLMMLIAGCALFAVGTVLHAFSSKLESPATTTPAVEPSAGGKQGASIHRIAYARQLGITELDGGYEFAGETFSSIEDAIAAATPRSKPATA